MIIRNTIFSNLKHVQPTNVISFCNVFQVQSNGRYKSVHHRAVTTKNQSRVSLAMFYAPNLDAVIGPVEDLIDGQHPKVYREYLYSEFLAEFGKQEGMWIVKEVFSVVN
ncbi:Feruloyl CoA ortho-hydroxylase F6H1-1 [Linum perenne]